MRSITLLGLLGELARSAYESGLALPTDVEAVLDRLGWPDQLEGGRQFGAEVSALRLLNDIRVEAAHGDASRADLGTLGVPHRRNVTEWGGVLDRLYDGVAESLDTLAHLVEEVL